MRLRLILFVFLFIGFVCLVFASLPEKIIYINSKQIIAEVAALPQDRERGLMFRQGLEESRGMLFIFENTGKYSFWMKNMLFPIDIIWLSEDKKVVDLSQNLLPCKDLCDPVSPVNPVRYVLEVEAGFIKKNNVKIGDRIKF